jgi:hypothetical protein
MPDDSSKVSHSRPQGTRRFHRQLKTPQSAGPGDIGCGHEAGTVRVMHVGASPTHTVNRLLIDTDAAFDDVRRRYESLVATIDFAELTALVNAGDLSEVNQYTAEHAPHTFVNFWTFDPTPMMQLFGHRTRAMTYMMGNNVIVERMVRHDPGVMRCVCLADPRVGDRARRRAGILHSGQLHMQVNRGGVVRPLARVHE